MLWVSAAVIRCYHLVISVVRWAEQEKCWYGNSRPSAWRIAISRSAEEMTFSAEVAFFQLSAACTAVDLLLKANSAHMKFLLKCVKLAFLIFVSTSRCSVVLIQISLYQSVLTKTKICDDYIWDLILTVCSSSQQFCIWCEDRFKGCCEEALPAISVHYSRKENIQRAAVA